MTPTLVDPNNYGSSSVEQYVNLTMKVFTNTATCVAPLLFILTNLLLTYEFDLGCIGNSNAAP